MSKFIVCSPNYVNYKFDRIKNEALSAKNAGKFLVMVLGDSDLIDANQREGYKPESFKCSLSHFIYPDIVIFVDHRSTEKIELCLKERDPGMYNLLKGQV